MVDRNEPITYGNERGAQILNFLINEKIKTILKVYIKPGKASWRHSGTLASPMGFPLFRDVSGHPVSGKSVKSGKI